MDIDWNRKFQAIKAVSPRATLDQEDGGWRVFMPDVRFYSGHEEFRMFSSGPTPEEAVNETWFYLTGEDHRPPSPTGSRYFPTGRIIAPMEKGTVILDLGGGWEAWVRWNGFMWASYSRIIQRKNDDLKLISPVDMLRIIAEEREECAKAIESGYPLNTDVEHETLRDFARGINSAIKSAAERVRARRETD